MLFVAAFALLPVVAHSTLRPPRRVRHGALHAARARPQRRRRLGRAARPRLRRVLRHRRVHLRDARAPTSSASTCRRSSSIPFVVIDRRDVAGFLVGLPSRRLSRRLPRDRHALLPGDLPHGGDERRPDLRPRPHGRRQRHPQRRSARTSSATTSSVQHEGAFAALLPVRRARRLRGRLRRPALRQPLAHRARLALAARGSARRRGDGHAGQPPQADGVQPSAPPSQRSRARSSRRSTRASSRSRSRSRC